ncbi:MAG TPA: YggS family pyridoxal phosphate-dependent enzyme, partial [Clostridiales bacterium]|nr:YggS family pyridoxal phosphate-dependent enzyme [Clostridiales bacterium]
MTEIRKNIENMKNKVKECAIQSDRSPDDIQIIAVGKTFPVEVLQEAYSYGVRSFGENKVQELVEKMNSMSKDLQWHMIGHLQKNKAKYIAGEVTLIHSLDSVDLAKEIDKVARKKDCIQQVLVQVNISEEETKFGLPVNQVVGFLEEVSNFSGIQVKGLMTIGPKTKDKDYIRE